jgi:hypothetical protein
MVSACGKTHSGEVDVHTKGSALQCLPWIGPWNDLVAVGHHEVGRLPKRLVAGQQRFQCSDVRCEPG